MCWAIARLNIRLDFDQVGLFLNKAYTEIQLPCDCLRSIPENLLPAQPHAVALRSLTCSNSDTIRCSLRTQPAAVEKNPNAVDKSRGRYESLQPQRLLRLRILYCLAITPRPRAH